MRKMRLGEIALYIKSLVFLLLMICSLSDLKSRLVDGSILSLFGLLDLLLNLTSQGMGLYPVAIGIVPGLGLLMLNKLTKGAIGAGDGIVILVTGIFLGFWGTFRLLTISTGMAAVFAAILMIVLKKGKSKEIPFVPFVFVSFLIQSALGFGVGA